MPGLEPGTSSLKVTRSNQLSYTRIYITGVCSKLPKNDIKRKSPMVQNRVGDFGSERRGVYDCMTQMNAIKMTKVANIDSNGLIVSKHS